MDDKTLEVTANRIKKHEGKEYRPYQLEYKGNMNKTVKEDFYTVGYGHVITGGVKDMYSEEEIETFFQQDFKKAQDGALRLLDGEKKAVEHIKNDENAAIYFSAADAYTSLVEIFYKRNYQPLKRWR